MPKVSQEYYLIDTTRQKKQIRYDRMLEVVSIISVFHMKGDREYFLRDNEHLIRKYWKWDKYYPSPSILYRKIRLPHIRHYIHHKMSYPVDENGWSSDFLHGLTRCGKVNYGTKPIFIWLAHPSLQSILELCPFTGRLIDEKKISYLPTYNCWSMAPALYLKYSEDSFEYIAGVFATGELYKENKHTLVKYINKLSDFFIKLGIPIERTEKKYIFISPVWPAIFSIYMPKVCRDKWLNIKNPFNSDIYCPILWRTYVSKEFVKGGIPYLKSRRMIFYIYNCEEGAIDKLDKLRIDTGLINLDNKVRECVRKWSEKTKEGKDVCEIF